MSCLIEEILERLSPEDRSYANVVRRNQKICALIMVFGVMLIVFGILIGERMTGRHIPDFVSGVYVGLGAALIAGSAVKLLHGRKLLHDEKALQDERRKNRDERSSMIAQKAMQYAGFTVLLLALPAMLIGSLFSIVVFWCFWAVIIILSAMYVGFYAYFNKKL
ncbi:hypothetical protein MCG98_06015 [Ruminococcus sp. OA3]|uniref:hypothetical protein n=1 Tax=Ruminococcus sp. OA3 TaxID=2914164 RepID=UPI001F06D4A5|nr:hypothetical protein [Ruminococcus sp. OA3]MCH1982119.1 hypothetical protein [Ruminococcus sp. OA3]